MPGSDFRRQPATFDNPALSNVWTTVDRSFNFIEITFITNLLSSWSVSSMMADLSGKVAVIREEVRQNLLYNVRRASNGTNKQPQNVSVKLKCINSTYAFIDSSMFGKANEESIKSHSLHRW